MALKVIGQDAIVVLRGEALEVVSGTEVEAQLRTPSSPTTGMGMAIMGFKTVLDNGSGGFPAADTMNATTSVDGIISLRQSLTAPRMGTPGTLYHRKIGNLAGSAPADAGVMGSFGDVGEPGYLWLPKPIIVATQIISLYTRTNSGTSTTRFQVMILYQLIELTGDDLIAALSLSETF